MGWQPRAAGFIGVKFHPECRSNVARPRPLFVGFVQAAMKRGVKAVEKAEA